MVTVAGGILLAIAVLIVGLIAIANARSIFGAICSVGLIIAVLWLAR